MVKMTGPRRRVNTGHVPMRTKMYGLRQEITEVHRTRDFAVLVRKRQRFADCNSVDRDVA